MALFFRPRRPLMRLAARAQQEHSTMTDSTVRLQRLAELHASGELTDVEFAAAKARLLNL